MYIIISIIFIHIYFVYCLFILLLVFLLHCFFLNVFIHPGQIVACVFLVSHKAFSAKITHLICLLVDLFVTNIRPSRKHIKHFNSRSRISMNANRPSVDLPCPYWNHMQTMSSLNEQMIERALFPLLWMSAEECSALRAFYNLCFARLW